MCISLLLEEIEVIHESSLPEKDKENLKSTLRTAGSWTPEHRAMYDQAVEEWDENHPKIQVIGKGGRIYWVESNKAQGDLG
ncbi:MAG TPA: hypothetical protein VFC65_17005 [Prolixibacteraceae bacterium]|nr:hypothetical protein [Prolixibacteraceae bacterium]